MKSPHEIKDQLEHVVSVHDLLIYLLKSKGLFVSYRVKLILTSLFKIQSLKFRTQVKTTTLRFPCSPTDYN